MNMLKEKILSDDLSEVEIESELKEAERIEEGKLL